MKYAMFRCCTTARKLGIYETSTDAVLRSLGCGIHEVKEFSCCGYPLKSFNFKAYVLASSRNLALAERSGMDILTICNCCYGSLKHAEHLLLQDSKYREEINGALARDGLSFEGKIRVRHLLQVLHDDIGIDAIQMKITRKLEGMRLATHYGCHLLRPKEIVQFDSPFAPTKFDRLVEVTGATSTPWSMKLDCCGAPLLGANDELSLSLTRKKAASARQAGADYVCVACPFCYHQFATARQASQPAHDDEYTIAPILYTQLLGQCLGADEKDLGLKSEQLGLPFSSAA